MVVGDLDFIQYWSAARLMLRGENPYDATLMLAEQTTAGRTADHPMMLWVPPYILPLILPLGLMSPQVGLAMWTVCQLAAVLGACRLTWGWYAGPGGHPFVPLVLAMTFVPTLSLLQIGQLSGFVLLGLVGFVALSRRGQPILAGLSLAAVALKPHLAAFAGLALILNATRDRGDRTAAGVAAAAVFFLATVAWLMNPAVFGWYRGAFHQSDLPELSRIDRVLTPVPATVLRRFLGTEAFGVGWLPASVGLAWFLPRWWSRRNVWDWAAELPALTLAAVLGVPYLFGYDLVVLIVPMLAIAARLVAVHRPLLTVGFAVVHVAFGVWMWTAPPQWELVVVSTAMTAAFLLAPSEVHPCPSSSD